MKFNISEVNDCYGCGVCAMSCPAHIVDLKLNKRGFYTPHILNTYACLSCGICRDVCSYLDDSIGVEESISHNCYASWSNDIDVRQTCSSGGVGYEVARYLINDGYKVVGVKYDATNNKTFHYVAETEEELKPSIGSKYIQSYTVDAFVKIDKNDKYLITGTPCQIDSFRRYIRRLKCEDNFILLDFFCHGVPSMYLWEKYCNEVKDKTGKILRVSWRNKTNGWHDSWRMIVTGSKSEYSNRWTTGDLFYKFFLSNSCLGKACYSHCKYKGCSSSADIRIGDLWGKTYNKDENGVSGVLVFTEKGEEIIKHLNCTLIDHPSEVICEGQMHHRLKKPMTHGLICRLLKTKLPLKIIFIVVQVTRISFLLKCKLKRVRI